MTILVDWQIEKLCIYEKMVEPFDENLLNPCSLDIRVGYTAKKRLVNGWLDFDLRIYNEIDPYLMDPGDRFLVSSLEVFNMPTDVAGQFRLKSSRAREFYEHLNAGWIDPGWTGSVLTMEIMNLDFMPLPLYPGLRMGQIIFQDLLEEPGRLYRDVGRYNGDKTVQESKG